MFGFRAQVSNCVLPLVIFSCFNVVILVAEHLTFVYLLCGLHNRKLCLAPFLRQGEEVILYDYCTTA